MNLSKLPALFLLLSICLSGAVKSGFSLNPGMYPADAGNINQDSTNLALIATPTTSFVSSWETLEAVNDGYTPSSSRDRSNGIYGNWNSPNTFQWVQYEWDQPMIINSAEIYWFTDDGGILIPSTAYLQYYKDEQWVSDSIPVPTAADTFNYAHVGGIRTNKIRVVMKNTDESTGIIEFMVWGTTGSGSTDINAPSAPGTPQVESRSDTTLTLYWSASSDDIGVNKYEVYANDSLAATSADTSVTVEGLSPDNSYLVSVQAIDASGNRSAFSNSVWIYAGADSTVWNEYKWSDYHPTIDYNFRDEFPALEQPTKDLDDCEGVVGTQSMGWWTFKWGPNARSVITEQAITRMLERMNKDFDYFRNVMGWPPDKRAKNGYRSAIYLYGSGLCTDQADSNALGGWQSSIMHQGTSWPMVLISYYPVYSFDPDFPHDDKEYQMGAVVHEGIHAMLADLPGVKKAAWFHEGGNVWLQQTADARRSGDYSDLGWLSGTDFIAPFIPIESYSGWLLDGSFGGPSAEGVNKTNQDGEQLCTWRTYLGGHQYSSTFPTFLGNTLGDGSIPWIWRYCSGRVLEGISKGIGRDQTRRLIMEYRAKQALIDFGKWSDAVVSLLDDNFQRSIAAEWEPSSMTAEPWTATPYVKTSYDSTTQTLTPEKRTTPGWSGSNQIPLNVTQAGLGDTVMVNFLPEDENMTCQLVYRTKEGTPVYSKPVSKGKCGILINKLPANGVIIAVVTNTNFIYKGEETRTAHFNYQIQLEKGILRKASIYKKWYDHTRVIVDPEPDENVGDTTTTLEDITDLESSFNVQIYPNPVANDQTINIDFPGYMDTATDKTIKVFSMQGQLIYQVQSASNTLNIPGRVIPGRGIYLLNVQLQQKSNNYRLIVH